MNKGVADHSFVILKRTGHKAGSFAIIKLDNPSFPGLTIRHPRA